MEPRNNKIYLIVTIILVFIVSGYIYFDNEMRYDINESPKKYILKIEAQQKEYIDFIRKYIKPEKLSNFLNIDEIHFSFICEYESGEKSLDWFKRECYKEMFYQMFDKNRKNYDDCPVTKEFANKYGANLFEYFNFQNVHDSEISCRISDKNKTIVVTEMGDFNLGEPGYIYYHHFHYILDDEGNVDDVIFDYTE